MSVNVASEIIIEDSRVMPQIVASLTEDSRGVIYNQNLFIVQATDWLLLILKIFFFFLAKPAILIRRSIVPSLYPSVRVPCIVQCQNGGKKAGET